MRGYVNLYRVFLVCQLTIECEGKCCLLKCNFQLLVELLESCFWLEYYELSIHYNKLHILGFKTFLPIFFWHVGITGDQMRWVFEWAVTILYGCLALLSSSYQNCDGVSNFYVLNVWPLISIINYFMLSFLPLISVTSCSVSNWRCQWPGRIEYQLSLII
jgi:hypothetical protein